MKTIIPWAVNKLSQEQRAKSLRYLMYLKEKRNGTIKAHGCAESHPQRLYKMKSEMSSPMVMTEAIFRTALVDAQ
jgi:uncharacterized protein YeaC (DUF1315 family)